MDNLKNLTMLFCNNCNLRSLYLKGLKKIEYFHCDNNKRKNLDIRNCRIRLSYGDEFFTYNDSVVLVRKHKNKSDGKIIYGVNG